VANPMDAKVGNHENKRVVRGSVQLIPNMGVADPDETRVKLLMSNKIASISERMGLRQAKVAELAGLAQSDVSRIVNGNVKDYSVWRLMRILNGLGQNISIEFSHSSADRGQVFTKSVGGE
jgi:predicted XRE-type DNA-binding protein